MCVICDVKKRGEAIHEALEDLLQSREAEQSAELSLAEAQVHLDNATAIGRLTQAAERLYALGEGKLGDRVLLALDQMLPHREERRTGETNEVTPGPPQTEPAAQPSPEADVDEFEGLPQALKDYILDLRKAGVSIKVKRFSL